MAFSLDPSRNHLAVNETDIIHLFRSTNSAVPPDPRFLGHPCQAYVCTAREHNLLKIFIAILDMTDKLPLIFTSSCTAKDDSLFKSLIEEAHLFAGSMGFSLAPVNLDYSTAMRQVIIRGLRVMRPPEQKYLPPAPPPADIPTPSDTETSLSDQKVQFSEPVLTPPLSLTPELLNSDSESAIEILPDIIKQLQRDNSRLESIVTKLRGTNSRQLLELRRHKEELDYQLLETRAACSELKEQLAVEVALRHKLELNSDSTKNHLQNKLKSLRSELEARHSELNRKNMDLLTVTKDRDRLNAELEAYAEKEAARREEQLSTTKALEQQTETRKRLDLHLAELTAVQEKTAIERELERRKAAAEIKSVTTSYNRIAAEKKVWDSISANFRKKARCAVERLRKEKAAFESEVQQLKSLMPATVPQPQTSSTVKEPDSPFASLGFTSQISSTITGNGADFRHDPAINMINYRTAAEFIDLYGSSNVIQSGPFGRRSQNCNAYICVVEGEKGPQIYLAWQLIAENTVLFCIPVKQPCGVSSYNRILKDAVYYFESIGFMMDRFELSRGSERQLLALEKTGICRRNPVPDLTHETTETGNMSRLDAAA